MSSRTRTAKGNRMTSIRRLGAALLGLSVTVTLVTTTSPAVAQPSSSDLRVLQAAIPGLMRRQIPLAKAAGVIKTELERRAYAGFAGIALEDDHVALWWKGALPERV